MQITSVVALAALAAGIAAKPIPDEPSGHAEAGAPATEAHHLPGSETKEAPSSSSLAEKRRIFLTGMRFGEEATRKAFLQGLHFGELEEAERLAGERLHEIKQLEREE
ncbi:hypothetical protein DACRYDRAFT_110383, partial [Dacryopinax primogenitus]